MINEDVRHIVEAELQPGETLLWADRPAKRSYPWRGVLRAGFWCFWMLFVCCWLLGVFMANEFASNLLRAFFVFVGTVFLVVGFAIRKTYLKGFLWPKYEIYGLTNKRAIVLSPLWKGQKFINWQGQDHSVNFIEGKELDIIKIKISSDKSIGTIIFSGWWDKIRYSRYIFPNSETPKILSNLNGFRNIKNAAFVGGLFENTFGTVVTSSDVQTYAQSYSTNLNEKSQVQKIREIKNKRVLLFSVFPIMWLLFTFIVGVSGWLFLSFLTFPYFITFVVYAIRESIRPKHSYRISS